MPIPAGPNYPSLAMVMNTVRAVCNDAFAGATSTPGEGQIITNQISGTTTNNPFVLNLLNSSIRELYRKLRIVGGPMLIQDNYILIGLDVVSGPQGPANPDPTIQTFLDNVGYWYGNAYDTALTLPSDLLMPLVLWERTSQTNDTFTPMQEQTDGLPPRNQNDRLTQWEWRSGRINFVGATTPRDIRIRYEGVFPQFFASSLNFSATYIPIQDCEDFVAYTTASKIVFALSNPAMAQALDAKAQQHLFDLRNQDVRRKQQVTYKRRPYNDSDTAQELDVYGI